VIEKGKIEAKDLDFSRGDLPLAAEGVWRCIAVRLTGSMVILAFLAASCAAPRRWQRLAATPSDAQRVSILRQQAAEGDATLADVLNREGDPDTVNLAPYSQSAYLRLDYTTSRKRYVLESSDGQPWKLVGTEVISSLPRYRYTDTVDAYNEYLRRFPDDPPEDIEFARNRIKQIDEEREKEERRAAAVAQLEQFIRAHPTGHDVREVYRALKARSQLEEKSEFETTQAYRERIAKTRTRPVLGALPLDAAFVFEVEKQSVRYDADAQQLEIVLMLFPVKNGLHYDENAESLPSTFSERSHGSYVGTNAFGAAVDVSTLWAESYPLVVKNVASFPGDMRAGRLLKKTLTVAPEEAKRAKENLRVFAISRLAPPFTSEGEVYIPATFDIPQEFHATYYYVHVEVLALWFYDAGTGRVITRIEASR
jgi:hypothetical protein